MPIIGKKTQSYVTALFQVESLKEQLWEIDTSNRNNLVFYGIKEESGPPELAIKDVIRRFKLTQLAP